MIKKSDLSCDKIMHKIYGNIGPTHVDDSTVTQNANRRVFSF